MAAISVEDDADVARCRPGSDLPGEAPGVEVVEEAEHRPQRSFPRAPDHGHPPIPIAPRVSPVKIWQTDDQCVNLACDHVRTGGAALTHPALFRAGSCSPAHCGRGG